MARETYEQTSLHMELGEHNHPDTERGLHVATSERLHTDRGMRPLRAPDPNRYMEAGDGYDVPTRVERDASAASVAVSLLRGIVESTPGMFAITASGHSMLDADVRDGDVVMLQETTQLRDGEHAALRTPAGRLILRRVHLDGDRVRLQPGNPRIHAEHVMPEDIEVIGRVVAIVRHDPHRRGAESGCSRRPAPRAA